VGVDPWDIPADHDQVVVWLPSALHQRLVGKTSSAALPARPAPQWENVAPAD
jgi:hypothetical protein